MKARLTITLDPRLLAHVDRAIGRAPELASRSAVIEEAVRRWSRGEYESAIRSYYAGRTDGERAEDDAWAELSAADLSAVAARESPGHRRPRKRGKRR